jgi:HK97 family phage portal protein
VDNIFKALSQGLTAEKSLSTVPSSRGWPWAIKEFDTGYWQKGIQYERKDVLAYHAVFACITLIASDISKLPLRLVRKDSDGIWNEVNMRGYEVIQKPNGYQNRIQFFESWVLSKFIRGNAYIFKERDRNGRVIAMHVMHPDKVLPMVSDEGDVFYQLSQDNLGGITETGITVPASEIIHDRFNCFYHPLVGLSPLFASGLPAFMGQKILENSANLFQNGGRPSGILTIPEAITKERAAELSSAWEAKYSGENYGKVAVLGGDLKYQAISMKAEEAQLVEQLKMTAEMVCSTFHVPPYKVGVGVTPAYNNVEALNLEYYNSALQSPIESIELLLDEGLEFIDNAGTEFDIDGLLRMDTKSQIETLGSGVSKAIYTTNEARKKVNLPPKDGGDSPMLQQQMWPIDILANRPVEELYGGALPTPAQEPVPPTDEEPTDQERALDILQRITKGFEDVRFN